MSSHFGQKKPDKSPDLLSYRGQNAPLLKVQMMLSQLLILQLDNILTLQTPQTLQIPQMIQITHLNPQQYLLANTLNVPIAKEDGYLQMSKA